MSPRVIIAGLAGVVIGLLGLVVYQARLLDESRTDLARALDQKLSVPEFPTNTAARPTRLRLQQLPPIHIRTEVQRLDWKSIESDDYATYVANLRAVGCPEETIRDIIVADVNQVFDARRRALDRPGTDWEFWRHPDEEPREVQASQAAREREAGLAALEQERRQLLSGLLGEGFLRSELDRFASAERNDRSVQFLPPEKREAVATARARYQQAQEELALLADPEQHAAASAAAEQAFEQALDQVLDPGEREQLEMRSSALADGLREALRGFGASETEFQKVFRLEKEFAREREALERAQFAGTESQASEKIEAGEIELQDKIRSALGEQRFEEYQRARDPEFQTLFSLAREHDVSPDVATEVIGMRQTVKDHTDRIRQNPLLTVEQKIRALEAIRLETEAAVVDVLGEPLLQEYQRLGGGWLVELTEPTDLGESGLPIIPPPLPPVQNPDGP